MLPIDADHRRSNPIVGGDGGPPRKRWSHHPPGTRSPSAGAGIHARISD